MSLRSGSGRIDLFVVADAVLISLACILLVFAYREISAAPARSARLLAESVAAVSMAADSDMAKDEPATIEGVAGRIVRQGDHIRSAFIPVETYFYTDHPGLRARSEASDGFLTRAWSRFQAGKSDTVGAQDQIGGVHVQRIAYPVVALADCENCAASGVPVFRRGDVIGVREVRAPHGEAFTQTIRQLLYAIAILATALMCVLGIIFPMLKRYREDGTRMWNLTTDLEREAKTDPLTGLANRRHFDAALKAFFDEFSKIASPVSLLMFDIDHFKQINDTHGHDAGDRVLKAVAERLRKITRSHDVVARIGGDEFAVITPYLSDFDLINVAERYRKEINELRVNIGGAILRPSISVGVATGGELPTDLFKAADDRLYEAKKLGRNRIAA